MAQVEIVVRYDGLAADNGQLSLYDAGESLSGLATVINLAAHSFANDNEVRDRMANPTDVTTTMLGAKRGCFENIIGIDFSNAVNEKIGKSVIVKHFWEYLRVSLETAIGNEPSSENPYVTRIINSESAPFEELAVRFETPLQHVMRPLKTKGANTVTFSRPYVGDQVSLDLDCLDYVSTSTKDDVLRHWPGNVTKYNILSGYGRAYLDSVKRTVPFNIVDFEGNQIAHMAATASMNERAQDRDAGKRVIVAHKVVSSSGRIKRLLVTEINKPHVR